MHYQILFTELKSSYYFLSMTSFILVVIFQAELWLFIRVEKLITLIRIHCRAYQTKFERNVGSVVNLVTVVSSVLPQSTPKSLVSCAIGLFPQLSFAKIDSDSPFFSEFSRSLTLGSHLCKQNPPSLKVVSAFYFYPDI